MSTDNQKPSASEELIDGRRAVYGEPTDTFARMAQMISGLLGHEVQAWQVPLILVITKLVRTNQCPTYSDNSDDIDGYMVIFRELIGEDMVHARTVDDYLEKVRGGVGQMQHVLNQLDVLSKTLAARDQRIAELESQLPGQS